MGKQVKRIVLALVVAVVMVTGSVSVVFASNYYDNIGNSDNPGMGPAPNFGDGVSDGPGW